MKYENLTSSEKEFVARLTEEERAIYMAKPNELVKFYGILEAEPDKHDEVKQFVDISLLIMALDQRHADYNDMQDFMYDMPNGTEKTQKVYDLIEKTTVDNFETTLTAANRTVQINLSCMDICNMYYDFLGNVKQMYFNQLLGYNKPSDFSKYIAGWYVKE